MLDCQLMPRVHIGSAKLRQPAAGEDETGPNLDLMFSAKTVDSDLLAQQCDQTFATMAETDREYIRAT
ncbi:MULTISPECIES: hypothetical protein [Streptomyces]|uniref:Uncharacterized protein n=2 Tax=Streptomyces TaxID=1883 RepID=A0A100Y1V0_9ACTN|nr:MULTISPECIES: hypothetical protein [Streptomyces]KUH36099.1 hypothetical protein ATE80_25560 [Streptomyces kanasensis]UUS31675.1 hypothetical protein NRO40_13080 [Streptomyces changanensis]